MTLKGKIDKYWESWVNHAAYVYNDIVKTDDDYSNFDKYQIFENAGGDEDANNLLASLQRIAVLCIENSDVKNRVFTQKYGIKPVDFYQLSYFIYATTLQCDPDFQKLVIVSNSICNSVSDRSIIENPLFHPELCGEYENVSEDTVFDVLNCLPIGSVVNIIERLDIEREKRQALKEFIITNNSDRFIEYSILNSISYSRIENICISLLIKQTLQIILTPIVNVFRETDSNTGNMLDDFYASISNPKFVNNVTKLYPEAEREINSYKLKSEDYTQYCIDRPQDILVDLLWKNVYTMIVITGKLRDLCPDIKLVEDRDNLIQSNPIFKTVEARFSINDLDSLPHFIIPTLEEFKLRFITDMELPLSCKSDKPKGSYFDGNNGWEEKKILKLYRLLTEEGLLSWDEKTCFSFLYRMSNQYRPSNESSNQLLQPIYWKGEKRELLSIVFYFHEGDTTIWKKCGNFFCSPKGEPIEIKSGSKNSAQRLTDRMNNILSNSDFKK